MLLLRKTFIYLVLIILLLSSIIVINLINKETNELHKNLSNKILYNNKVYQEVISSLLFDLNDNNLNISLKSLFNDKDIAQIELIDYTNTIKINLQRKEYIKSYNTNIPLIFNKEKIGELHISYTNDNLNAYLSRYKFDLITLAISISFIFFIFIFYFLMSIIKNLNYLTNITSEMAKGEINHTIFIPGKDSLAQLAYNINAMKESFEKKSILFKNKVEFQNHIINNINIAIYIKNEDNIITSVNEKFKELFDLPKEKIIGKKFSDILNSTLNNNINLSSLDTLANKEPSTEVLQLLDSNNNLKDLIVFEKVYLSNSGTYKIIGSIYDTSNIVNFNNTQNVK